MSFHEIQEQHTREPISREPEQKRFAEPIIGFTTTQESELRRQADSVAERVRGSVRALQPEKAATEVFAHQSNEQKSASKRGRSYHRWGSSLNRKRLNFHDVKNRHREYEQAMQNRMEELGNMETETRRGQMLNRFFREGVTKDAGGQEHYMPPEYRESMARFFDEETVEKLTGDETGNEMMDIAVKQFLALDLNVDIRTDKSFAANAGRIEEIISKTDAIQRLLHINPGYQAQMDQTEEGRARLAELHGKLMYAHDLSRYCKIQRAIITNKIYRTHFRSEIGLNFREGSDSRDETNLKLLIWMAERQRQLMEKGDTEIPWEQTLLFNNGPEEREYTRQLDQLRQARYANMSREQLGAVTNRTVDIEGAKNDTVIEDGPHAEYFREHNHPDDPIYQALNGKYQIAGSYAKDVRGNPVMQTLSIQQRDEHGELLRDENGKIVVKTYDRLVAERNKESFARQFAAFRRWRAVQAMPAGDLREMLENLAKKPSVQPASDADPEEVYAWQREYAGEIEECRRANIAGLLAIKNMYKRQMMYLRYKYGDNMQFITRQDQEDHADEMKGDFTDFQSIDGFVEYLKRVGLFYSNDDSDGLISDSEFEAEKNYYGMMDTVSRRAPYTMIGPEFASYSSQRMNFASEISQSRETFSWGSMGVGEPGEVFDRILEGLAKTSETDGQEQGIRWGCDFTW